MKLTLSIIVLLSFFFDCFCQERASEDTIERFDFNNKNEYHYKAIYINSEKDTVTNELLILKLLDKKWFVQPGLQNAIRYYFHTDTADYRNYIDPRPSFKEKNEKYYKRKGKAWRLSKKETTGAYSNSNAYYAHPPRANQYRMLFYAPHPLVPYQLLQDTLCEFIFSRKIIGAPFTQTYQYSPTKAYTLENKKYKSWNVNVNSVGQLNDYMDSLNIYDSKLEAVFCPAIGFTEMKYIFENGIVIFFRLEKIIKLND